MPSTAHAESSERPGVESPGRSVFFRHRAADRDGAARYSVSALRADRVRTLLQIATDVARPNGVALSPDERTLYLATTSGEWVFAYALDRSGRSAQRREFARLVPPPADAAPGASGGASADGLAVDEDGRLYVATTVGVQVFSAKGAPLGALVLPKIPQNLAFSGKDRRTLFVVGRGAVYRIVTQTKAPKRPRK